MNNLYYDENEEFVNEYSLLTKITGSIVVGSALMFIINQTHALSRKDPMFEVMNDVTNSIKILSDPKNVNVENTKAFIKQLKRYIKYARNVSYGITNKKDFRVELKKSVSTAKNILGYVKEHKKNLDLSGINDFVNEFVETCKNIIEIYKSGTDKGNKSNNQQDEQNVSESYYDHEIICKILTD